MMSINRLIGWGVPLACLLAFGTAAQKAEAGPLTTHSAVVQTLAPSSVGWYRWGGYGYGGGYGAALGIGAGAALLGGVIGGAIASSGGYGYGGGYGPYYGGSYYPPVPPARPFRNYCNPVYDAWGAYAGCY